MSDVPSPVDLAREPDFTLGAIEVRPSTREVITGGKSEIFEPRVLQVFVALARRRGQIVSRDDLIRDCWDGRIVGEDALNRCIGRIRRLSKASGSFTLETVPRVGYRIVETAAAVPAEPAAPQAATDRRGLLFPIGIAGAVLLAGIGIAIWLRGPAPVPRPVTTATPTIAVVPFEALGSQEGLRVFGDAVAEQILSVLSDNQVQAVSRAASESLRGPDRDAAATRLGAAFIVEGTVVRGNAGMHVTVHLDHVATHVTLWTGTFDQANADSTTLQAQVAAKIVDVIRAALIAQRKSGQPLDDETLSAYVKAMEHVRMIPAPAHLQQALDLLHTVVLRSPNFSPGYSGLAMTSERLAFGASPEDATRFLSDARAQATYALKLDPHNGEAYLALAGLVPSRHWAEQETLYRRGLAVDPNQASIPNAFGGLLAEEGRTAEALVYVQRAMMLDPLSPVKTSSVAYTQIGAGQCADAVATIERAAKLWPLQPLVWDDRVYILANCNRTAAARALLASAPPPSVSHKPGFLDAWNTYLDALEQNTPDAKARASRAVLAAHASGTFNNTTAIEMLARLGDLDGAFALADISLPAHQAPGEQLYPYILFRQMTAAMRKDKRFMPIMQRIGLAAYWAKSGHWPDFCSEPGLSYACRAAAAP